MKALARIAVQRPITSLMISLIVIGFGLFGLTNLKLNLYPDVSFPTITVFTTYEGVAPEDMETLITRPVEEAVGSISGIRRIRSLSSQGASVVKLNFNWGTNLYFAESDVRKELDFVRRSIPEESDEPIVFSYDPNQEPVVVLALTSEVRNPREIRTIARQRVEQRLERIAGVASGETAGGLERQINIQLSNRKMRSYNVTIDQVATTLQAENVQIPAGELTEGRTIYSLRTLGEFKDINQMRNTIITTNGDQTVLLRDIATVEDGISQPIGGVHVDGNDGVILNVYRQSDANVVTTASAIVKSIDDIKKVIPDDVNIKVLTNKADFINDSIDNLLLTGVQAILLVVIILLFFLQSGRSAFIIAVSIPISIISTFMIMDWADLTLNIISLSGLTLAIGMVVDDAVVVLENIFRFKEDGHKSRIAAVSGAQEVAVPVVISTLTTLVVFLPILFVPGIAGFLFRDLALTISFALIVSSFVALSIIPVMSSKLLNKKSTHNKILSFKSTLQSWKKQEIWVKIISFPFLPLILILSPVIWVLSILFQHTGRLFSRSVGPAINKMLNKLESTYHRRISQMLNHSWSVVLTAFLIFLLSLPLFFRIGGQFFPQVDQNFFVLEVQREPGVSLLELERTISQVEAIVKQEVPEARLIVSDFGDKTGIEGADNPGGFHGTVRVELIPTKERRRSQFEITADVIRAAEEVPGAEIKEVVEDPLSPEGETGLIVQIFGYDQQQKAELAEGVKQAMAQINGIVNVFSSSDKGRPELQVVMDRERISRLGMTTQQVANTLSNSIQGNIATTFIDQGIEFDVEVELDYKDKATAEDLKNIQIQTPDGQWMPISNLVRFERYTGPTNILRINQERVNEITADLEGIDLATATKQTRQRLEQINWPDGYRYEFGGTAEEQEASFNYLLLAFLIAGILTYMVMASQFESLTEPFIIILTIPLAITGVLIMLWATGTSISVTSMVGLILLAGIVVNNGIVMIDYIKILQVRKMERKEAIALGASRRLRPILMTAFTTILAMVPLALELGSGAETWSPMARTVIGGLTVSTILMLFVVPCMYNILNRTIQQLGFDAVHKEDPLELTST